MENAEGRLCTADRTKPLDVAGIAVPLPGICDVADLGSALLAV